MKGVKPTGGLTLRREEQGPQGWCPHHENETMDFVIAPEQQQ